MVKHWLLGLLTGGLVLNAAVGKGMVPYEALSLQNPSSFFQLLDREQRLIHELRTDFNKRRGNWLTLDHVSPALQRAILASEDQRFMQHRGVDWLSVAGAAWSHVATPRGRGASTLSMQLADLLGQSTGRGPQGRTLSGKLNQAYAAYEVEGRYDKSEIFEAYLNLAPFRGEIVGVDALARVLFQKHASGLNMAEAALAAAMLRAPNANKIVLTQRACAVLVQLGRPELCRSLDGIAAAVIHRAHAPMWDAVQLAPHFTQRFFRSDVRAGLPTTVPSTLDRDLQETVQRIVYANLHELQESRVNDAAVVVLDNDSGEILAYAGASSFSEAPEVDHVAARRQAGSTLKPFLYALAIADRRLTAASLLEDSALSLNTLNGLYVPQNYNLQFTGWVSARKALASSLNIPAVRVLTLMPIPDFWQLLRRLGLPLQQDADFYGYSLALGSADVDLLSLTNAYRTLANLGCHSAPVWRRTTVVHKSLASSDELSDSNCNVGGMAEQRNDVDPVQPSLKRALLDPAAAWIVSDMLSDRQARAYTFGLDSALSTPFWTAVKTGTSKDMRDNWAIGYSSHYTVGVWVGNSDGEPMMNVSGVSGAAPVWHEVMRYLHSEHTSTPPLPPHNVVSTALRFEGVAEPDRNEYFLAGTEFDLVKRAAVDLQLGQELIQMAQIVSPVAGTVYAFDPDIPAEHQKIRLAASRDTDLIWKFNGTTVANGSVAWWPLTPGRFIIDLFDKHERHLDRREIMVRGAKLLH